jgi:hypothetical protein
VTPSTNSAIATVWKHVSSPPVRAAIHATGSTVAGWIATSAPHTSAAGPGLPCRASVAAALAVAQVAITWSTKLVAWNPLGSVPNSSRSMPRLTETNGR